MTLNNEKIERMIGCTIRGEDCAGGCAEMKSSRLCAVVTECDFSGTEFERTNLSGNRFASSDMSGDYFEEVNLSGAAFEGCDLSGVEFTDCKLDGMTVKIGRAHV